MFRRQQWEPLTRKDGFPGKFGFAKWEWRLGNLRDAIEWWHQGERGVGWG